MIPNDFEESEIVDSFERGEWQSVLTPARRKQHQLYAKNTLLRNKQVKVRISLKDWRNIQLKAMAEGISCQALMSTILHNYTAGRLVDKVA